MVTHMCPCGTTIESTTIESRTHTVGECEIYKEGRGSLEEGMRKLNVCDMEESGRLESSGKAIAVNGRIDVGRRRLNGTGIG